MSTSAACTRPIKRPLASNTFLPRSSSNLVCISPPTATSASFQDKALPLLSNARRGATSTVGALELVRWRAPNGEQRGGDGRRRHAETRRQRPEDDHPHPAAGRRQD